MTWTNPPRRRIIASTMSPLLTTLLQALPGFSAGDPLPSVEITQVTADSRQVQPGALFVAVQGAQWLRDWLRPAEGRLPTPAAGSSASR